MDYSGYQLGLVPQVGALGGLGLVAPSPLAPGSSNPEIPSAWRGGGLWLGCGLGRPVGDVTAVAVPRLLGNLPSTGNGGIKYS